MFTLAGPLSGNINCMLRMKMKLKLKLKRAASVMGFILLILSFKAQWSSKYQTNEIIHGDSDSVDYLVRKGLLT